MFFYDEDRKKMKVEIDELVGKGECASVYKIVNSLDECIKIYNKGQVIDREILTFIRSLDLKNFYKLYKLLFNKNGNLKAYTMKFYEDAGIDILTMPVEYTLYNLYNLYQSVIRLAENNIFVSDMHTGNVILGSDEITVTDVDMYSFSELQSIEQLKKRNTLALRYLFEQLFLEALHDYHSDIATYNAREKIQSIFELYNSFSLDRTCNKLIKYKYPIDYVRKIK